MLLAAAAQVLLWLGAPALPEALVRQAIGEIALRQVRSMDAAWEPGQRDCAGLVRYVYRDAIARYAPKKVSTGLWRGPHHERLDFADAETLVANNFTLLGRGEAALGDVRTGDIVAFRQSRGDMADAVYHLMVVVAPTHHQEEAWVVYHPGDRDSAVRAGKLRAYMREAPREWQPTAGNPAFLGYFRFKDWSNAQSIARP